MPLSGSVPLSAVFMWYFHSFGTTDVRTAQHAWEKSCYFNIDYKIDEADTVYDAISRMSAYNVGCLIVTKNGVVRNLLHLCYPRPGYVFPLVRFRGNSYLKMRACGFQYLKARVCGFSYT